MKVLLDVLDDASQLLAALDRLDELDAKTREKLKGLLEGLCDQSTRLLRSGQSDDAPSRGGDQRRAEPGGSPAIDEDGRSPSSSGQRFERRCRQWLLQRSLEALAEQDYQRALKYLSEASEAFPDDCEFHIYLGLVHWELGEFEASARAYGEAMTAAFPAVADGQIDWFDADNREYLRAMEGRALCLCRLERNSEALALFDALAEMNGADYGGCRYMAGELRHLAGDLQAAIDDYRQGPTEPASLYNQGLAHFQHGDCEAAASTFIRAFVSNIHVFHRLSGRQRDAESCVPGYLGGSEYAADFVGACTQLWEGQREAIDFMEACFDHPLVDAYLVQCQRDGGQAMLEGEPADGGQGIWLDALADQRSVDGLAESVVKRISS